MASIRDTVGAACLGRSSKAESRFPQLVVRVKAAVLVQTNLLPDEET